MEPSLTPSTAASKDESANIKISCPSPFSTRRKSDSRPTNEKHTILRKRHYTNESQNMFIYYFGPTPFSTVVKRLCSLLLRSLLRKKVLVSTFFLSLWLWLAIKYPQNGAKMERGDQNERTIGLTFVSWMMKNFE